MGIGSAPGTQNQMILGLDKSTNKQSYQDDAMIILAQSPRDDLVISEACSLAVKGIILNLLDYRYQAVAEVHLLLDFKMRISNKVSLDSWDNVRAN